LASGHTMEYLKFKIMEKNKELSLSFDELNNFIVGCVSYGNRQVVSQATFYRWLNEGVHPLHKLKVILDSMGAEIKEIKIIKKDS